MSDHPESSPGNRYVLIAIGIILAGYLVAAACRLPQRGTELIVAASSQPEAAGLQPEHGARPPSAVENANGARPPSAVMNDIGHDPAASDAPDHDAVRHHPPYWTVAPFALLLGAIAVLPLIPATEHWWESNLHRFYVAGGLALVALTYYFLLHAHPIHGHWPVHHVVRPAADGPNWRETAEVFANAIFSEYVPFIVLLFSLYTISGGIRIAGDLKAHPLTNTGFLLVGGFLASMIGTTGAAMLLIRCLLETNAERKHVRHTVVFFIFIVCNCGGLLLPTGDPPLFLGYLMGVDFFWTLGLWPIWLFVNGSLAALYFLLDAFWFYPRESKADVTRDETRVHPVRISGLWPNGLLLLGVVASVALLDPSKAVPGTEWHPWMYLREIAQLALVAVSLGLADPHARHANKFNYGAIVEVAVLFLGIFICMQPALQILGVRGPSLGLSTPTHFFWSTGLLSSFLDNAPTYVVFFETAKTLGGSPSVAGVAENLLVAVSLGAVFMGANTYIGNGPNFMVKAIAEKSGVRMPGFFGYMLYSVLILLPLFALTNWLFFD